MALEHPQKWTSFVSFEVEKGRKMVKNGGKDGKLAEDLADYPLIILRF